MNRLVVVGTEILNSPFYGALVSSFIVSSVIGLLLPSYLLYLKKPRKLTFLFTESGKDEINFHINADLDFKYSFNLSFKNCSKGSSFKDTVYWHLFIQKELLAETVSIENPNKSPVKRDGGDGYDHFSGGTDFPIYPDLFRSLGYRFDLKLSETDKSKSYTIYYYFGTEFGLYPNTVEIPVDFKDCQKLTVGFNKEEHETRRNR